MPGETILIVEDNDITRQGLQMLLEADGYKVLTAAQGLDALKKMRITRPDLILSDISMPVMDGYSLYNEVRTRPEWVTIPFIFLTARGGRDEIYKGKQVGAEDYLVKPFNHQDLLAVVRSRLIRNQELVLAQLQNAYESSLLMFSSAIDRRSSYAKGHGERVSYFSLAIAHHIGLDEDDLKALQFGSILHDIGNIYIQETILNKPGPLNDEEWDEIKRHTLVGAEMVKNIPNLSPATPVIISHHERWDGKGYPHGLKGEAIPVAARIIALTDALDAMTTDRIYKPRLTAEQAYQEILSNSGKQFDPQVVRSFEATWHILRSKILQC